MTAQTGCQQQKRGQRRLGSEQQGASVLHKNKNSALSSPQVHLPQVEQAQCLPVLVHSGSQLFSDPGKKGTLFGEDHF